MRRFSLLARAARRGLCLTASTHIAVDGAVLGRVVIYRNGVAFYERRARVADGKLDGPRAARPRRRLPQVADRRRSARRASRSPVSIPRQEADDGSYLTMTLETAEHGQADVLLTYVTESPAWKPSYRVVVGDKGKVMLEGWAIVDNVSGEDWKGVLVGVGASSALSFRYDLWSVRRIDRDLLAGEERFAIAPPTGVSPYAEAGRRRSSSRSTRTRSAATSSLRADARYVRRPAATRPGRRRRRPRSAAARSRASVTDNKTGEKLAGATVIATSPEARPDADRDHRRATARTGSTGLPPGSYLVAFYYGDIRRSSAAASTSRRTSSRRCTEDRQSKAAAR